MPIEIDNLSYYYPCGASKEAALDGVSLKIKDGELIGIMGHTGCGKTTLIQLIAGLLVPGGGKVLLDGKDINAKGYDRGELRKSVGIVFQYPEYQLFETTVEKDVAFGLKYSGLNKAEVTSRVKWALETMGFSFDAVKAQSPLALSGGEKRRVAIAGVLAARPKVLIFDEPIAGLDPTGREAFLQLISRLNREGTTVLVVSHNADALGEIAQRIVILDGGRIAADGTVKELFSDIAKMQSLRLGVSAPRMIAEILSKRGMGLSRDIVCYDELLSELKTQIKGRHAV